HAGPVWVGTFPFGVLPPVRPATDHVPTSRCRRSSGRRPRARHHYSGSGHRRTPGFLFGTPCRTGRRTGSRASSSLWCATPSATSQPSVEVLGSCQSPGCLLLRALALNRGPFPRPELPGFSGTMDLSVPRNRPSLSLAGVWLRGSAPSPIGFPVLRWISLYRHAVVITPVAR